MLAINLHYELLCVPLVSAVLDSQPTETLLRIHTLSIGVLHHSLRTEAARHTLSGADNCSVIVVTGGGAGSATVLPLLPFRAVSWRCGYGRLNESRVGRGGRNRHSQLVSCDAEVRRCSQTSAVQGRKKGVKCLHACYQPSL